MSNKITISIPIELHERLKARAANGQAIWGVITSILNDLEDCERNIPTINCARCNKHVAEVGELKDGICGNCADDLRDIANERKEDNQTFGLAA
jgi:bacterioferritin-associated ferredoxin